MVKIKQLTPFGVEVKKRLLEMRLTQREFCREHHIPENRFSEILYSTRPGEGYRAKIAKLLNISFDTHN